MAVRLKNTGDAVDQYHPAGHAASLHVDGGEVIEVPGDLVEELDDAYLIGAGPDDVRAWPKARWQAVVDDKAPARRDPKES